ncbi:DUF6119 family protein [Elizabethkingia anophelis]|uniref:DUF6119 family protein n=1 Tax=Elizabethkingia anophelis TaxID=1117645 RepID=UPI0021A5673D|nr:TIGR04141 family sporadically distributed protein [Elizabethkingia anophelis]MCT3723048.1 TIGR04141 family sporadically distributed protein [Elizabethkingia anophelis]MCT4004841.1 TIGR04141 family sporadically distributed protein [Elizabethkingia anophelis]MDV3995373.1 hypothetical protein [Elizabethkingia anophelis]
MQIPTIYKIDKQLIKLKDLNDDEIILKILNEFRKDIRKDDLSVFNIEYIEYNLFTFNTDESESAWKEFFPSMLSSTRNFFQQSIALVLFIKVQTSIYVVIGGNAYRIILPFIDPNFGIDTYSKLIKPTEDSITSIKARGITGKRAGFSEQYRDDFKIIDYIKFGNVPKEIQLKLSKKTSRLYFKFLLEKKRRRVYIVVGKGLKIKKRINFNELHKIIKEIVIIGKLESSDFLSSYLEITDRLYIENNLKPLLIDSIYNDIRFIKGETPLRSFQFDFCNPNNIAEFYEADEYVLKEKTENGGHKLFKKVNNKEDIYKEVMLHALKQISPLDKFKFMVFLQGVRITCYKDKLKTISASFLYHINSEFKDKTSPVFLIDNRWYKLRDTFVKELRTQAIHILKTYKLRDSYLQKWNSTLQRESEYNLQYEGQKKFIVIDTILIDGIELCDILYYNADSLYLTHVKKGFNADMRELTNQVLISARRLKECLGSAEKLFLIKLYNAIIQKGRSVNNLSLKEFINLFETKLIIYTLAFKSEQQSDLLVEDNIDNYSSNIAKFSLIECSSEMRVNYYNLEIFQIQSN